MQAITFLVKRYRSLLLVFASVWMLGAIRMGWQMQGNPDGASGFPHFAA
jgi:hypothetical protein